MKVLQHDGQHWILLEDEGRLLLDVNCSHSFISYGFLMALNKDETACYLDKGRDYLDRLADDIQYSAPGVLASKSKYKERNIQSAKGDAVTETFIAFRNEGRK